MGEVSWLVDPWVPTSWITTCTAGRKLLKEEKLLWWLWGTAWALWASWAPETRVYLVSVKKTITSPVVKVNSSCLDWEKRTDFKETTGFGTSKPPLLGCTGTSGPLEEIPTTSPSSESPQVELASASRCRALFCVCQISFCETWWNWFPVPLCTKTLTPHNKGLIRRAISQSGVALCPWAVNRNPRRFAEEVQDTLTTLLISPVELFQPLASGWMWSGVTGIMFAGCSEGQLPHWWKNGRLFEDDWPRTAYLGWFSPIEQLTW